MNLIGKAAYDAYARATGGKTYDGRKMPEWDELPMNIQVAWESAALKAGDYAVENAAGRIHNVTILKLTGWDRIRALFGRNIRTDLRIDWALTNGRMTIVKESADTYVSRFHLNQPSSGDATCSRLLASDVDR